MASVETAHCTRSVVSVKSWLKGTTWLVLCVWGGGGCGGSGGHGYCWGCGVVGGGESGVEEGTGTSIQHNNQSKKRTDGPAVHKHTIPYNHQ